MLYKTNCALSIKGSRVERGAEIELSEEEALRYSHDITLAGESQGTDEEVEEEKALEEMSHAELKAKAKSLGLTVGGGMADLKERIALHQEGTDEEVEEEN